MIFTNNEVHHEYLIYFEYLLGFILTIIFLYTLGIIVSNVLGKQLYKYFEYLLNKIPVVNKVYHSIKQITSTLSMPNNNAFKKVVYIEYPRKGLWTLCMVTGESFNNKEKYYNVFVPTTPNPTSGFLLFIKSKDVRESGIPVEDGLKIIISGGMLAPKSIDI